MINCSTTAKSSRTDQTQGFTLFIRKNEFFGNIAYVFYIHNTLVILHDFTRHLKSGEPMLLYFYYNFENNQVGLEYYGSKAID